VQSPYGLTSEDNMALLDNHFFYVNNPHSSYQRKLKKQQITHRMIERGMANRSTPFQETGLSIGSLGEMVTDLLPLT
jgi:hypothetical protein